MVYIYTMEYYSAITKNTLESVLMRWINLEPTVQSEVSQKEKDKYCVLTQVYRVQKDGTDEPICRAVMETQTQRIDLWTVGEGEGGMNGESSIHITLHKIDNQWEFTV